MRYTHTVTRAGYKMGRQSQQSGNIGIPKNPGRNLGSSYPRQSVQVCRANSAVLDYLSSEPYRPLDRAGRSMVNCSGLATLEANRNSLTEVAE